MTDELKVEPDDLDRFATVLRDLSGQADTAKKYVSSYFDIDGEQSRLFFFVKGMVDKIRQDLEANYDKLARLSDASSIELVNSSQMYRTTDHSHAKQLDAQYMEVPR
ncbi:hypothetical protein IU438_06650 [Nocardia cyriacigeorgica]|uniref:type VII secretion target n=1 Tax=Nocardia cyriacigeorgica TaxID=135487 RepID=UPI00189624D7|nr:type VII secretion target [Nocardia cyriacigeorgica]MBF6097212.1 hypothetical protein [Nocardia cyriacigeorgica]MBF6160790.1 hypothetical protein [Nocardia cyriacigeorgica]MBF6201626.1 hypothetical protein [Nocardia cyriacigeorgica]MBF6395468.1 hypothetical protein [Nocardia cyriacigeorgica]MBF6401100.1 hypothetical protein [Nocardia cyriacigeorgica]